jgi:hypothetical protein
MTGWRRAPLIAVTAGVISAIVPSMSMPLSRAAASASLLILS